MPDPISNFKMTHLIIFLIALRHLQPKLLAYDGEINNEGLELKPKNKIVNVTIGIE